MLLLIKLMVLLMLFIVLVTLYMQATIIDPADVGALETALNEHKVSNKKFLDWFLNICMIQKIMGILTLYCTSLQVSLFFTESPTNPFLRCVDIKLVSDLCHRKGAIVCIDGTFATPMNQKALALGADLVVHSATKYLAGHNDVS